MPRNVRTHEGVGALVGAILAALGMSVVAVLVLRAIGEWKEVERAEERCRIVTDLPRELCDLAAAARSRGG